MTPYIGQIILFAGTYVPAGWHLCDGSLLQISDYNTLYALISTTYGGDGVQTFGVPDLRSKIPIGQGQGPGLSSRILGETAGEENVTLTIAQIPSHTHALSATSAAATTNTPAPGVLLGATPGGGAPTGTVFYFNPPSSGAPTPGAMATGAVQQTGGSLPHNNLMPYTALNYLISLNGIFPSRN